MAAPISGFLTYMPFKFSDEEVLRNQELLQEFTEFTNNLPRLIKEQKATKTLQAVMKPIITRSHPEVLQNDLHAWIKVLTKDEIGEIRAILKSEETFRKHLSESGLKEASDKE